MKSPEQLANALKQITDLCNENDMPAIFVGTIRANDDVNIIAYPGHDTSTAQGIEAVAQQLYKAAVRTPKSKLATIILNVSAAICVSNPVIEQTFYADLAKKTRNETMSALDQLAISFASAKCKCDACPVGHDKFDLEQQDVTCDKFNCYVKLYKEIAEPYDREIEELKSEILSLQEDLELARL